jgi:hypothetical protein
MQRIDELEETRTKLDTLLRKWELREALPYENRKLTPAPDSKELDTPLLARSLATRIQQLVGGQKRF